MMIICDRVFSSVEEKKTVHAVRHTGALQMQVSGKKRNLNCWGQLTLIAQAFGLPLKCNGTLNRVHEKKASEWCHASTTPERHIRGLLEANPPAAVVVVVCSDQFHCCLSGCCSFAAGQKGEQFAGGRAAASFFACCIAMASVPLRTRLFWLLLLSSLAFFVFSSFSLQQSISPCNFCSLWCFCYTQKIRFNAIEQHCRC